MTALRRVLLGAGIVAALAGVSVFLRLGPEERPERRTPPAAPAAAVQPVAVSTSAGTRRAEADLRDVPAGIIARAANARALERAPACRPVPRRDAAACEPQRDAVEIRWDVAKEP